MKSINISENFTIKLNWDNIYIISQTIMTSVFEEAVTKIFLFEILRLFTVIIITN